MVNYAIDVDWSNYYDSGWENVGRDILRNSCSHYDADESNKKEEDNDNKTSNVDYQDYCEECEISEDSCEPMMNYAYPLETVPSDEDILKVVKETCLTIMEKDGSYYLALCGGGMNLSQSIGLAYVLIENWIPKDLIGEISKQKGLSVSGENWKLLRSKVIEQLKRYSNDAKGQAKEWEATEE